MTSTNHRQLPSCLLSVPAALDRVVAGDFASYSLRCRGPLSDSATLLRKLEIQVGLAPPSGLEPKI